MPEQQAALRNFNSHLHRIEVITFNQLLRIANRVLSVFHEEEPTEFTEATKPTAAGPDDFDSDIPF